MTNQGKEPLSPRGFFQRTGQALALFVMVLLVAMYANHFYPETVSKEAVLVIAFLDFIVYFSFAWGWFARYRAWIRQQQEDA